MRNNARASSASHVLHSRRRLQSGTYSAEFPVSAFRLSRYSRNGIKAIRNKTKLTKKSSIISRKFKNKNIENCILDLTFENNVKSRSKNDRVPTIVLSRFVNDT